MADSFQIDVVLLDERLFQFEQRNIVEVVLVFQKGPEMTQHRPIAPPGTFRAIYADTFEKIIRVMFENIHKSPVSFAHTQPGILDLFSRDVGIVIANRLIVFADLDADIVQMAVDAIRFETAAFGAAAADLPKRFRDGELRAELRDAAVDRDATHDRDDFLIFVFVPFEVEQNLERAAHKLCFFKLEQK